MRYVVALLMAVVMVCALQIVSGFILQDSAAQGGKATDDAVPVISSEKAEKVFKAVDTTAPARNTTAPATRYNTREDGTASAATTLHVQMAHAIQNNKTIVYPLVIVAFLLAAACTGKKRAAEKTETQPPADSPTK
jgi:hypothetical protein